LQQVRIFLFFCLKEFFQTILRTTAGVIAILSISFSGNFVVAQSTLLEEVIVTAQKREQSIQDVGIAITAFSGEQLRELNLVNNTELGRYTPGVSISGPGGGDQQQFTIRGATQNDFSDHSEAPNALYVDEVYQASQQSQLFATYDLQRVEILKGPQGTLFGRNATGGLLHFVTNKPSQEFDTYVDLTYGRFDQMRAEGAVGGGLSDTVSARVSGVYSGHDNIYENNLNAVGGTGATPGILQTFGRPAQFTTDTSETDDAWAEETWSVRGQLLFEPNDDVNFLVKGQYSKQTFDGWGYQGVPSVAYQDDTDGDGLVDDTVNTRLQSDVGTLCEIINVNTGACIDSPFDGDFDGVRPNTQGDLFGHFEPGGTEGRDANLDFAPKDANEIKLWSLSGKLDWNLDFAKLVSVTAFSEIKQFQGGDVGAAPTPHFNFVRQQKAEWFSQELRLEGERDRYRWIAGAYYLHIKTKSAQGLEDRIGGLNTFGGYFFGPVFNSDNGVPFFIPTFGGTPLNIITGESGFGVGGDTYLEGTTEARLKTDSYSLFGQVDYDLTEKLTLNVGFRAIIEKKDYSFTNRLYINARDGRTDGAAFAGAQPLGVIFAPTIPIEFLAPFADDTSDFLWSGKVQLNYSPSDDLLLYAGINRGVKAGNFNGPLLTTLTQDEYTYKEEVLLAYEAGFKSTILDGKARLNFSAYYYDYKDYQAFQFVGTSGAVFNADAEYAGLEIDLLTNPIDNVDIWLGLSYIDTKVKGIEVADNLFRNVEPTYTPDLQFTGVGRYTWPSAIAGGSVTFQLDGTYADDAWGNINNFDSHILPSNWVGNVSLRWRAADGHWEVGTFLKNFTDNRAQNSAFDLATIDGSDEQSFEKPRWWGVNVRYDY
jgi:iron complex outermembrane receptor protein